MPLVLVLVLGSMALAVAARAGVARGNALRAALFARALVLILALGFAAGGLAGIIDLVRDPLETLDTARVPYVLFGAIFVGGLVYAIGTVLWTGWTPFALRLAGWLLIAAPLAVPSTLTLGFPLAAILFVTLTEISEAREVTAAA